MQHSYTSPPPSISHCNAAYYPKVNEEEQKGYFQGRPVYLVPNPSYQIYWVQLVPYYPSSQPQNYNYEYWNSPSPSSYTNSEHIYSKKEYNDQTTSENKIYAKCNKIIGKFEQQDINYLKLENYNVINNKYDRKTEFLLPKSSLTDRIFSILDSMPRDTPGYALIKSHLLAAHKEIDSSKNEPENIIHLAANLSGDKKFRDFIVNIKGKDVEVEGISPASAILFMYEQLEVFAQEKGLENELKEHLEDYAFLYLTALFKYIYEDHPNMEQIGKKFHRNLMIQEIGKVQSGERRSLCWTAGSETHFIPMRAEFLGNNNVRISHFNLGNGINRVSEWNGQSSSELRLGELDRNREIVCTPGFLGRNLYWLCEHVTESLTRPTESYLDGIHQFAPSRFIQDKQSIAFDKPQEIGDCSCKGQWILNKKSFQRRRLNREVFQDFEYKVLNQAYRNLLAIDRQESAQIGGYNETVHIMYDFIMDKYFPSDK